MNNPIVNQRVLEAFINIYLKNPQTEDKHSAMAEELGIDREEAKKETYKLLFLHPSFRFIEQMGSCSELNMVLKFIEDRDPSREGIISFLEERNHISEKAYSSFFKGIRYNYQNRREDIKKLRKARADTNI